MGYYTRHQVQVHSYGESKITDKQIIDKIMEYNKQDSDYFYPIADAIENEYGDDYFDDTQGGMYIDTEETKWYDSHEEMLMLSKDFPEITFKVHGDGEEAGDSWDMYYRNGKSCEYRPIMPPFNPKDLK